jgi:hypothetical protein
MVRMILSRMTTPCPPRSVPSASAVKASSGTIVLIPTIEFRALSRSKSYSPGFGCRAGVIFQSLKDGISSSHPVLVPRDAVGVPRAGFHVSTGTPARGRRLPIRRG